jgi:hypothetical protein
LLRTISLEGCSVSSFWYMSMTNDATMDENKAFCKITRKRLPKIVMWVVSHQENH